MFLSWIYFCFFWIMMIGMASIFSFFHDCSTFWEEKTEKS